MTASQFKAARLALGLTQAELGEALGYTIQMISRYENGHNPVPRVVATALSSIKTNQKPEDS